MNDQQQSGCPIAGPSEVEVSNFTIPSRPPQPKLALSTAQGDLRAEDQPGGISGARPIIPILPEGEAILQPPLDNTPNDAPDREPPARIPNLGHAVIFLAITGTILLLSQLALLVFTHTLIKPAATHASARVSVDTPSQDAATDPELVLASETFAYVTTLGISWFLFPLFWRKPFAIGIQANPPAASRNALRLIPIGITLSFIVQAISSLITVPKSIPMDEFFRSRLDVWLITAFGILLAPLFEEILFRGFLFPAFAIAYDWLSLPRIPAAHEQWNSTNHVTRPAMAFSAVLTSILFALLHGAQTAFTWPIILLLFLVSLVLTAVRIRLRSVLASTLVHASYNFAVFFAAFLYSDGYRHLEKLTH